MKRVIDIDNGAENLETPTSPKRYITLQNAIILDCDSETHLSVSRDLDVSTSKTVASSSSNTSIECVNESLSVLTDGALLVPPCVDLANVEDRLLPNDEPIIIEYAAGEHIVLPDSNKEHSSSKVHPAIEIRDKPENSSQPQRKSIEPKNTTLPSKWPDKIISMKLEDHKKTIIVHKPAKSIVGKLHNPIVPRKQNSETDCCIVQTLMRRPFTQKSWSDRERINIISKGPPQPDISPISLEPGEYKKFPWLAGCVDVPSVYCWYCLLFSSMGVWSTSSTPRGYFAQVAKTHNSSGVHVEALMLMRHWKAKMNLEDGVDEGKTNSRFEVTKQNKSSSDFLPGTEREATADDNTASDCTIDQLLGNNFVQGSWTVKERESIIRKGRPLPKMDSLIHQDPTSQSPCVKYFSENQFKKVSWLTGSPTLNKLFCWPCVLFMNQGAWGKCGYGNLHLLTLGIHRHEITQQHLEACLRLKVWERQVKKNCDVQNVPVEQHNEAVRRSREFMKYVIDVICYFKKTTENTNISYENFMNLVTIISRHDIKLKHYLRTRSFFENEISGITKSTEACLKQKILKDVNRANFVSLILNGVRNKPWISVVLRYVENDGQVHETFLQFIEFTYGGPVNDLLEKILGVIGFLKKKAKLVGFTHDDFAVKPSDLALFTSKITHKYPSANFFHYSDHNLKTLLQQSLSHISYCKAFIHNIRDLVRFFERHPIAKTSLTIIRQEVSGEDVNSDYVWNFTTGIINVINDHYLAMIKLFERMIRSAIAWNSETVAEAHNFLNFLYPLDNRFLIATFSRILAEIDELTKAMETGFEVENWKRLADKATEAIIKTRCEDFEVVIQSAWNMLPSDQEYAYDIAYAEKFDEIMESASLFINCRTKDLEKWSFIELITNPTLDAPSKSSRFNKYVEVLKCTFPLAGFDKLSTQLNFFKGNSHFNGKSVDELIKYIYDLDMINALPALHRFGQLMLTVPLYPISTSKVPAVKRIEAYTNNRKDFTSSDAFMYVEKYILDELQKEPEFHEDVITHFADNFGGEHLKFRDNTD